MNIIVYIIIGIPLAAVYFVLCVLAFGPAFIAARDWWYGRNNRSPRHRYYRGHF